jgi:hypothetical protein
MSTVAIAAPPAVATPSGSITLASQSTWVAGPGRFSISLTVKSKVAPSDLGIVLTLYSALPNRLAFAASTTNTEWPSETCLDRTPVLPLDALSGPTTDGTVAFGLDIRNSSGTPSCADPTSSFSIECSPGQCDDVYPLSVALVDTTNGRVVRSMTTHVVVASRRAGSTPLSVTLIAPLGARPTLAPAGTPLLGRSVRTLSAQVRALAQSRARFSLSLYPDLLLALKREGGRPASTLLKQIDALVAHGRPSARVELLSTPFADLNASALAENGLASAVVNDLAAGKAALEAHFDRAITPAPYASASAMNGAGLAALERSCVSEFVVPESSVPALSGSALTPTAPIVIGKTERCGGVANTPIAFVADAALSTELSVHSSDPVLAGENVLADLAQVYFEGPFDPAPRAVVAMAAPSFDPETMRVVLEGLVGNPITSPLQLSGLFRAVPPGSNRNLALAKLAGSPGSDAPPAGAVMSAMSVIKAIKATVPNNHALLSSLNDAIFTAESTGMTRAERASYLDAPMSALRGIGRGIAITGSGQVTLTARRGKVPITIQSSVGKGPVVVKVRLQSSQLLLPPPLSRLVVLGAKDTSETVTVGTRTSGSSDLDVTIYSAVGPYELDNRTIIVRSTAVSGVAIVLSGAALVVLLAWWLRSILRVRRTKRNAKSGPAG